MAITRRRTKKTTKPVSNVETILQTHIKKRDAFFLSKFELSNDEIIEIRKSVTALTIQSREFLFRLVNSQKGPFNDEVVRVFTRLIDEKTSKSLLKIIKKSDTNITNATRYYWSKITMHFDRVGFNKFINSDASKKLGFEMDKEPLKRIHMLNINRIYGNTTPIQDKIQAELHLYFDSMSEDELFDFYDESNSDLSFNTYFTDYPKITGKIIEHYIENTPHMEYKKQLAKHPKCPIELRMKIYEETGDDSLLPKYVQDIFIF